MYSYHDIKRTARTEEIPYWKIAERAGIGEATLYRWFRFPETDERVQMLSDALAAIMKEREQNG